MFDMLDDDLELDYVPTMMTNSRSGNMKKMTKKEPKAQPKPPPKVNKAGGSQYDDLLDEFDFDYKKTSKPAETKPAAPIKNMFNSLDSEWDQPKSTSLDKKKAEPVVNNVSKAPTFKFDHVDDIIHQEQSFNSFGKTQQTIPNASKAEESFVSSRNMKPPMRKKNEPASDSLSFGMASVGLTIPEQTNNKTGGLKLDDEDIIRPPPRLMNRRSSVDGKSQKNEEALSLPKNNRSESPINTLSMDYKKEVQEKPRQALKLSLDQPKIQHKVEPKKEKHIVKFAEKEEKPIESDITKTEKIVVKQDKPKKGLDLHVDQSITILRDSPGPTASSNKQTLQQYEKQLQHVKLTFQKQIDFLQENLDRQIAVNRETRDKLMRQSNKMIEQERARTKKVQEEEMRRAKEMFEWQKKRMEDSFQAEITNLRQSLEYAQKNNNYTFKTGSARDDNQYMESQLKHQKKLLEDREKILEKREIELSDRQLEYNKRKRKDEDRLRDQQKRLVQAEMKIKKQLMEEKKTLNEEKQQMAIELAGLEIQAMKRKERAQYSLKENLIEKEGLQNERYQLRNQNAQLMTRYRAKVQQVQNEKQRLKLIENDLIKKLRIVQQRMKEPQSQGSAAVNKTMYTKQQNNWIEDRDRSHQNLRSYSIQRDANKSSNANQTKQRFHQLQSNTKNKLNISAKENKKFDLDNYMMTVEEYKKMRGEA